MRLNVTRRIAGTIGAFALLICMATCANAALMTHFKGRYGAIEVFDSAKKLSFRVNAPELSQTRNFCQFNDLSVAITAVEFGLIANFDASVAEYLPLVPGKAVPLLTLRQALRAGTPEVFSALRGKISTAQMTSLTVKSALPTKLPVTSAFALIDWFKALNANALALKPTTREAVRSLLTIKSRGATKLLAFSSRCSETTGAVAASVGILLRAPADPVFFAVSVDGKNRADLFYVAPTIRDAALNEFGYWPIEVAPESSGSVLAKPIELAKPVN